MIIPVNKLPAPTIVDPTMIHIIFFVDSENFSSVLSLSVIPT